MAVNKSFVQEKLCENQECLPGWSDGQSIEDFWVVPPIFGGTKTADQIASPSIIHGQETMNVQPMV